MLKSDKFFHFVTFYQLKKVKKNPRSVCFIDQLLDKSMTGKYIVKLLLEDDTHDHVIGIDCDNKLIYDCMEDYALPLTKQSIDVCGGKRLAPVIKIPNCYEFISGFKPKAKKRKI